MESLEHQPRRRRRRRSRKRARYSAVVVALLSLLGILAYESVHFARIVAEFPPIVWHKPGGGIERYEPTPDYRAARTVYPYSVVPGGILNEVELEASMAKDPVVAQHYRDILAARIPDSAEYRGECVRFVPLGKLRTLDEAYHPSAERRTDPQRRDQPDPSAVWQPAGVHASAGATKNKRAARDRAAGTGVRLRPATDLHPAGDAGATAFGLRSAAGGKFLASANATAHMVLRAGRISGKRASAKTSATVGGNGADQYAAAGRRGVRHDDQDRAAARQKRRTSALGFDWGGHGRCLRRSEEQRVADAIRRRVVEAFQDQNITGAGSYHNLPLLSEVPLERHVARFIPADGRNGRDASRQLVAFGHVAAVELRESICGIGRVPAREVDQRDLVFRRGLRMGRQVIAAAPMRVVLFGVLVGGVLLGQQVDVEFTHPAKVIALVIRRDQFVEIRDGGWLDILASNIGRGFHHLAGVDRWVFEHACERCGLTLLAQDFPHEIQAECVWHQQRLPQKHRSRG